MGELKTVEVRPQDVVVDNTILSDMICSTRGAMRHVLGLGTKEEGKELRAGQAVHTALAWHLAGKEEDFVLGKFDEEYQEWSKENVDGDDPRAWRQVRRIVRHWIRNHPLATWQFTVEKKEIEVPLQAVLGVVVGMKVLEEDEAPDDEAPRVVMVALLDAIGKKRTGGGKWSVDHKSSGWTGDGFTEKNEDSSQFTGQMWLASVTGYTLGGVYVNAIELRQIPGSDRKCSTHGQKYADCGINHLNHRMFPVTRTKHEIEAWEETARMLTRKYLRLRRDVKELIDVRDVPMEGRFIANMCRYCEFRDWCRMGRPSGAGPTFVSRKWNPLEHAAELKKKFQGGK